jgi:hypothetical protein
MELSADGTDYLVLQSGVEAAFGESWEAVLHVLGSATTRLTRKQILKDWPEDYPKPDTTTLWRWLGRAAAQGMVRQNGTGRHHDPFRYWLVAREPLIRPDGGTLEELAAWNDRCMQEMFARLEKQDRPAQEAAASGLAAKPPAARKRRKGQPVRETPEVPPEPGVPVAVSDAPDPIPDVEAAPRPPEHAAEAAESLAGSAQGHGQPVCETPEKSPEEGVPVTESDACEPIAVSEVTVVPAERAAAAAPEPPVPLPFPWGLLNPAEVPEWVWKQARAKAQ